MISKSIIGTIRNIDKLIAREKDRQRLIRGCCELLATISTYRLAWILLVDKDRNFTALAAAGPERQIIKDLAEQAARGEYLQCAREILTQESTFAAYDDVEKLHKGCPLVSYHTEGAGFTGRLEYDGRIYGTISVNVLRESVMDTEEQLLFQKLAGDISSALAAIEREETGRQAEQQLRLQAECLDAATDSVHLCKPDGSFLYVNKATCALTGYSNDELLKMNLFQIIAQEYAVSLSSRKEILFKQGHLLVESAILRKDGSVVPIEIRTQIIETGGEKHILTISRDITERKAAEEVLRESESKYRTLVENSLAGIYIIQDKLFRFVNKRFCEIHGYSYEEVVDKLGPVDITLADDREIVAENVRKRLNGEIENIHYPIRTFRKDGEIVIVDVLGCSIIYKGRRAILGTVIDITERKRTEEALLESESRYRLLAENLTDIIWTTDLNLRFTYVSPSIERIRGYSVEEALKHTLNDILTPASFEVTRKAFMEGMEKEKQEKNELFRVKTLELEEICKDGSTIWTESKVSFLRDHGGKVLGVLGVTRDISDRKEAEKKMSGLQEQLRQSQKLEAIGSLAGGIAHDFNNLLTVISGYSQLSLSGLRQGDPLMDNLEEILKATNRATDLTRQLLAFSRRQVMEMKVLDVNKLIHGMEKMLNRMIGEDIKLLIHPAEDPGRIKADPGQIEQVILNLAVNSRDAMPLGGRLIIETDNVYIDEEYAGGHVGVKPGHYVRLTVSDTGCGIPPENRDRIFDPFFSTKDKGKGTGLGLATVYGIIKQSGGNIWVYSEPDKGTTFKIYLPGVDEPFEENMEKKVKEELPSGKETILVVEDEEIVRKLAVHMLSTRGYKLLEAANSGEALLICEQHKEPIHLILTDVVMPRMSGPEFIKRLRQIRKDFKVLFMSGYTDEAVVLHGVQEGEVDFIQKPFTLEGLSRKVREVLDKDINASGE